MLRPNVILLTGGSGYLGGLIASTLLAHSSSRIIALARQPHTLDSFVEPIEVELASQGYPLTADDRARVELEPLPPLEAVESLVGRLRSRGVREIIHCAGCVDYFDVPTLEAVNVTLTRKLLELGQRLEVERFVYISTAYSSGYVDGVVSERLHPDPVCDPTDYTRTKRRAEWAVAMSGLPYVIVRPSIVIGDSRTGRYSGKRYGLYQQWMGVDRLLCDRYHAVCHTVAPRQRLNFVHQDAFQEAFRWAYQGLAPSSIVHIVSRHETSPTMRELGDLWMGEYARPELVYYYDRLAHVPLREIHPRQRAYLMFASANLEIASHPWVFETEQLNGLRQRGLVFADATLESIALCLRRFVSSSPRMQCYVKSLVPRDWAGWRFVEVPPPAARSETTKAA